MQVLIVIGFSLALAVVAPAAAQMRSTLPPPAVEGENDAQPVQQQRQAPIDANQSGRVARSSVGQAGERQTRDTMTQVGIKPMARIASRIESRVQNRIRNRIDRNYDPQANAMDPFAVAQDQARTSIPPR